LEYADDLDGINKVNEFIENTDLSNEGIFINYWKITEYQKLEVEFIKWGKASGFNDVHYHIALDQEFVDITDEHEPSSLENVIVTVIRIPDEIERAASVKGGSVDRLSNC